MFNKLMKLPVIEILYIPGLNFILFALMIFEPEVIY